MSRNYQDKAEYAKIYKKGVTTILKRFLLEEEGQALVEYGLLTGIVAMSLAIVLRIMALKARGTFQTAANAINTTT